MRDRCPELESARGRGWEDVENRADVCAARRHSGRVDRAAAEEWIRARVAPVGAIETERERPWATVLRVPLADSVAWFKACAPVQQFEPRLTAELSARWPDRVAEVLAHDEGRG